MEEEGQEGPRGGDDGSVAGGWYAVDGGDAKRRRLDGDVMVQEEGGQPHGNDGSVRVTCTAGGRARAGTEAPRGALYTSVLVWFAWPLAGCAMGVCAWHVCLMCVAHIVTGLIKREWPANSIDDESYVN